MIAMVSTIVILLVFIIEFSRMHQEPRASSTSRSKEGGLKENLCLLIPRSRDMEKEEEFLPRAFLCLSIPRSLCAFPLFLLDSVSF